MLASFLDSRSSLFARRASAVLLSFAALVGFHGSVHGQSTWFVKDGAPAGGTGTSWASPFHQLDLAISAAAVGDQIWVTEGTYKPRVRTIPSDPRSVTFSMTKSLAVYGAFLGFETSVATRAGSSANTILDGDIGVVGSASDNAYHVITSLHDQVYDGFTMRNGNADAGALDNRGGAINSQITQTPPGMLLLLVDCHFDHNHADGNGGAIFAQAGAVFGKWCTFSDNTAGSGGAYAGAVVNSHFYNSIFSYNSASVGGGATWSRGNLYFENCAFYANSAQKGGAGYVWGAANPNIVGGNGHWTNCSFAYNTASVSGGAIFVDSGAASPGHGDLHNCIAWFDSAPASPELAGTLTVEYSDIQGGAAGVGNINLDPKYKNPSMGRLNLSAGSPAIDAGLNPAVPQDLFDVDDDGNTTEQVGLDVEGQIRFLDDPATVDTGCCTPPIVDMGAYEFP